MKVGCFQPHVFSNLPQSVLVYDSLLHFLLCYLVSSLSVVMGGGEVRESFLQVREECFAERRVGMRFIAHHERKWSLLGDQVNCGVVSKFHHGCYAWPG